MIMKHMSKLIAASAPAWMDDANGNAVWCRVSGDGLWDEFAWILPFYNLNLDNKFMDNLGRSWQYAVPVTDKETLDETEGMR